MLVRAYARGVQAVARHRAEVVLDLPVLAAVAGRVVGVEVHADVVAVLLEVVQLRLELCAVGKVLAVYGVVHAVFQAAADEVGDAVAVHVGEAGDAVVAELGVVVALVVRLVQLDVSGFVKAGAVVDEPGDIPVEGAHGEVV